MKYKDYTADDLIKDEFFQQWVFAPTEESNRFWLDYLENYPKHRERVEEARQFLSFFHVKDKDVFESRISNLKKRINVSIDQPEPESVKPQESAERAPVKKMSRKKIRKITTSVMVLLLGVLLLLYALFPKHQPETKAEIVAPSKTSTQSAPNGKRTTFTLPDGTQVWLNAGSALTFLKTFSTEKNREVVLEGEAYFEVMEDLQKPFIVNTKSLVAVAYATSFNIKSYDEGEHVEVILVSGKVSLESNDRPLNKTTVAPDQKAVFEKRSQSFTIENQIDADVFTQWRSGIIVMGDQSFAEIKPVLERWYNVSIEVEDEQTFKCHFTARLDNKTLEEVMEMFRDQSGITYEISDHRVVIKGNLCAGDQHT